MPQFTLETQIAAPEAACFSLSLSVDAHTSSMARSSERAIAGVTSGTMTDGDTVTWRATHFGLPWRMTSEVVEVDSPRRFVDRQVAGPFAAWRHEHRFEPTPTGTRMIDIVDFHSPCGVLGRIVDRLVLGRYMTRLLVARNDWLKTTLESDDSSVTR